MSGKKVSRDFNVDGGMTLAQNFRRYLTDWRSDLHNVEGFHPKVCAQINTIDSVLSLPNHIITQKDYKDYIEDACSHGNSACVDEIIGALEGLTAEIKAQKQAAIEEGQADAVPTTSP